MKFLSPILLATLSMLAVVTAAPNRAQTKTQNVESKASASPQNDAETNVQAYIDLLHSDVRQQKAEFMGSVALERSRRCQILADLQRL